METLNVRVPRSRPRRLLVAGLTGLVVAAFGLACCATPLLAVVLGAAGAAASAGAVGTALDAAAVPLALLSLVLLAAGLASAVKGRARPAPSRAEGVSRPASRGGGRTRRDRRRR